MSSIQQRRASQPQDTSAVTVKRPAEQIQAPTEACRLRPRLQGESTKGAPAHERATTILVAVTGVSGTKALNIRLSTPLTAVEEQLRKVVRVTGDFDVTHGGRSLRLASAAPFACLRLPAFASVLVRVGLRGGTQGSDEKMQPKKDKVVEDSSIFHLEVVLNEEQIKWKMDENATIQAVIKHITREHMNSPLTSTVRDVYNTAPNIQQTENETMIITRVLTTIGDNLEKDVLDCIDYYLRDYIRDNGDASLNWSINMKTSANLDYSSLQAGDPPSSRYILINMKRKQRSQARSAGDQLDLTKVLKKMSFLDKPSQDKFQRILIQHAKPVLHELFGNRDLQGEAQTLILQNLKDDQVNELFDKLEKSGSDPQRRELLVTLLKVQNMWSEIWHQLMDTMSDDLLEAQIKRLRGKLDETQLRTILIPTGAQQDRTGVLSSSNGFDEPAEEVNTLRGQITDEVYKDLLMDFEEDQWVSIFMTVLQNNKAKVKIIFSISDRNVFKFWNNLSAEDQNDIWNETSSDTKADIFIGKAIHLNKRQKMEVWLDLTREERLLIWDRISDKKNKVCESSDKKVIEQHKAQVANELRLEHRALLDSIGDRQIAELWMDLPYEGQLDLYKALKGQIGFADSNRINSFWQSVPYETKKSLLSHMKQMNQVQQIFKRIDIGGKLQLYNLVDSSMKKNLEDQLDESQKREMFFYTHFNLVEETKQDMHQFIDGLIEENKTQNNQFVPFEKIEGGFTQVLPNPLVRDGFITFQLISPQLDIFNTKSAEELEFESQETMPSSRQMTTENSDGEDAIDHSVGEAFGSHKAMSGRVKLIHNRYGRFVDAPCHQTRQAAQIGQVSFFEYSPSRGMQCLHSFAVPNPIAFKTTVSSVKKHYIHKGRGQELFFFYQLEEVNAMEDMGEIQVAIIQLGHRAAWGTGESGREVRQNCEVYRVGVNSPLNRYILEGNAMLEGKGQEIRPLNPVPTLVRCKNQPILVFSHFEQEDVFPAIHFHDLEQGRVIADIRGGEVFLDYFEAPSDEKDSYGIVMYLTSSFFLSFDESNKKVPKNSDELASHWIEFPHRHEPRIVRQRIQLEQVRENLDETLHLRSPGPHGNMVSADRSVPLVPSFEMQDDSGHFADRYRHDCPIFVEVGERDELRGTLKSVTILFQYYFADTYFLIPTDDASRHLESQANQNLAKLRRYEDPGSLSGRSIQMSEYSEEQDDRPKPNFEANFDKYVFQIGHRVPEAEVLSQGLYDNKKTVHVHKTVRNTLDAVLESESPYYEITLQTFSVSEMKASSQKSKWEKPPSSVNYRIEVKKDVAVVHATNKVGTKYVRAQYKATPAAFVLREDSQTMMGAFLYDFERNSFVSDQCMHWIMPTLPNKQSKLVGDGVQELRQQTFKIDYPLVAYNSYSLDNREVMLVNLADSEYPQLLINVFNLQFLTFVGHSHEMRDTRIAFLAQDGNLVQLCYIRCIQPFEKKDIKKDIVDFSIEQCPIQANFLDEYRIKRIKSVDLVGPAETGKLVVQTIDNVLVSHNATGAYEKLIHPTCKMQRVLMQRGYNNKFYFVQEELTSHVLFQLTFTQWKELLLHEVSEVYRVNEGKINVLEIDQENYARTDSVYSANKELTIQQVPNALYIIDDTETLMRLREPVDAAKAYTAEMINFSSSEGLKRSIMALRNQEFAEVQITRRTITIEGNSYNLANGHSWKFISRKEKQLVNADLHADLDLTQMLVTVKNDEHKEDWRVERIEAIEWSQRLIAVCSFPEQKRKAAFDAASEEKSTADYYVNKSAFVTKLQPGSRRQDLVGQKGIRDMESINFISDDLFLVKFKSADTTGLNDYWSVIDKHGQIKRMPEMLKKFLRWDTFVCGESTQVDLGCFILVKGGQKSVLSIVSDFVYEEQQVHVIEFNRIGEPIRVLTFDKQNYQEKLQDALKTDLKDRRSLLFTKDVFEEEESEGLSPPLSYRVNNKLMKEKLDKASEIVDTLKFAQKVLCSHKQDLYRVATIKNENFRTQVAANTMSAYKTRMQGRQKYFRDKLHIGLFEVDPLGVKSKQSPVKKQKTRKNGMDENIPNPLIPKTKNSAELLAPFNEEQQTVKSEASFQRKEEGEEKPLNLLGNLGSNVKLKIIVFLCQDDDPEDKVLSADFCVVGDFLCWRFPDEEIVHTISIQKLKMDQNQLLKTAGRDYHPDSVQKQLMETERINYASGSSRGFDSNQPSHKNQIMPNAYEPEVEAAAGLSVLDQTPMEQDLNERRPLDSIQGMEESDSVDLATPRDSVTPGPLRVNDEDPDQESDSTNPISQLRVTKNKTERGAEYDAQSMLRTTFERRRAVEWSYHTTSTIDLDKITENDIDRLNTHLSELPKSTQLSIARKLTSRGQEELSIHYSLLQVTVGNRVIIYDLGVTEKPTIKMISRGGCCGKMRLCGCQKRVLIQTEPEEVLFFNATQQLIDPHVHADTGFCMTECITDNEHGFYVKKIIENRQKSYSLQKISQNHFANAHIFGQGAENQFQFTPVCGGVFKKYTETDLYELERIRNIIKAGRKLEKIDMETLTCKFEAHSCFSIFRHHVIFFEQVWKQVSDSSFPNQFDYDEAEIQNSYIRRLFYVMKQPVPDLWTEKQAGLAYLRGETHGTFSAKKLKQGAAAGGKSTTSHAGSEPESAVALEDVLARKEQEETQAQKDETHGLLPILHKSLSFESVRVRDCIFGLANISHEVSIEDFATNLQDFSTMVEQVTPAIDELIRDSFIATKFTKKIGNAPWTKSLNMLTFRRSTSMITDYEAKQKVKKRLKKMNVRDKDILVAEVEVLMLDLTWLFKDNCNFIDFVRKLTQQNNKGIYSSSLVKALLAEFWNENLNEILMRIFYPFIIFMILTLQMLITLLDPEFSWEQSFWMNIYHYGLVGTAFVFWLYQLTTWLQQMKQSNRYKSCANFARSFFRIVAWSDAYMNVSMAFFYASLVFLQWNTPILYYMRVVYSFTAMSLWYRLFEWTSLFQETSFYVILMKETIIDCGSFLALFVIGLMMFGTPMQILNMNSAPDQQMIAESFYGITILNYFYNQYLLSLGEFDTGSFDQNPYNRLCWALFWLATFFTCVMLLNMLIAIMGDTFERVMENKDTFSISNKMTIMGEYSDQIQRRKESADRKRFLFVITPVMNSGEEQGIAWEGRIRQIKQIMDKKFGFVNESVKTKLEMVQDQNVESKTRDIMLKKELKGQYLRTMDSFRSINESMDAARKQIVERERLMKQEVQRVVSSDFRDPRILVDKFQMSLNEKFNGIRDFKINVPPAQASPQVAANPADLEKDLQMLKQVVESKQRELLALLLSKQGGEGASDAQAKLILQGFEEKQAHLTEQIQHVQSSLPAAIQQEVSTQQGTLREELNQTQQMHQGLETYVRQQIQQIVQGELAAVKSNVKSQLQTLYAKIYAQESAAAVRTTQ